ncbi:MAG: hypothetical protein QW358_04790, partial [Candidatus Hadarchaeum sp.]
MKKIILLAVVAVVLAVLVIGLTINLTKKPPAAEESPTKTQTTTTAGPTEEEFHYTFTRDWLKKNNIWVFDQPSPEYLKEIGATGTAFSVYYIGFNEYERDYVETLHRNGFRVVSNLPCGQSATTENMQLREEAAQRDIHGNPILLL